MCNDFCGFSGWSRQAKGEVLEVAGGTGRNLTYYGKVGSLGISGAAPESPVPTIV
jgi:hypothetical protein